MVRTRRRLLAPFLCALLGTALAAPGGLIAYVHGLPGGKTEFRTVRPDGTGDHAILTLPINGDVFVPELAWRPDGAELGFVSDHEAASSVYAADLYAVKPDGSGLRRITNAPDPSALKGHQTASVTVTVRLLNSFGQAASGGPFLVYVQGAPAPKAITASATVRFDGVAVFPGRVQFAVVMEGLHRWINAGVGKPLTPGKVTDLGTLSVSGDGQREFGAYALSWRSDSSALLYRFGECCLYQIAAKPRENDTGAQVLKTEGFASLVAYAPKSRPKDFLYTDYDVLAGTRILLGQEGRAGGQVLVTPPSSGQRIYGLAWLPDGSGFVYSMDGLDEYGLTAVNSNLYLYRFATRSSTQLSKFTSGYVIRMSLSPDGQQVVFEHSPDDQQIDGLWLMGLDGSNPHVLVKGPDVARPAWGAVK